MSWEYKVIEMKVPTRHFLSTRPDFQSIEQQLNELGRMNWELVNTISQKRFDFGVSHITVMMKRHK